MSAIGFIASVSAAVIGVTGAVALIYAYFRTRTVVDSNQLLRAERDDRDERIAWLEKKMVEMQRECDLQVARKSEEVAGLRGEVTALQSAAVKGALDSVTATLRRETARAVRLISAALEGRSS